MSQDRAPDTSHSSAPRAAMGPWQRRLLVLLALAALSGWQISIFRGPFTFDPAYAIPSATTTTAPYLREFFYLYHYLGLFPVAVLAPGTAESAKQAERNLRAGGQNVVNEITNEIRRGENGRMWLFAPDAWLKGTAKGTSLRPGKLMFQLAAVLALFSGGVLARRPWLGLLLALLFGSDPFQLSHTLDSLRVLGVVLATWAIVMGLNLPLFLRPALDVRASLAIAAASGALLCVAREIRADVASTLPVLLVLYALRRAPSLRERVALPLVLLAVYSMGSAAMGQYWDHKLDVALQTVEAHGGVPFPRPPLQRHHEVWHPIACGLGDFDRKHGFEWNDTKLFARVMPKLQATFPSPLPYSGGYYFDTYYEGNPLYPVRPSDFPAYHRIVRDLVVDTIASDPLWYAEILLRRALRVATEVTPLELRLRRAFSLPVPGFVLLVPVVLVLLLRRRRNELAVLALGASPSATALLVHSAGGTCYLSVYHLVAAALALEWALRHLVGAAARRLTGRERPWRAR
ncbi:MAG: hypothetical protein ACHQ53_12055 [Polyangiales bacterium]